MTFFPQGNSQLFPKKVSITCWALLLELFALTEDNDLDLKKRSSCDPGRRRYQTEEGRFCRGL
jgi:hypothetical protein